MKRFGAEQLAFVLGRLETAPVLVTAHDLGTEKFRDDWRFILEMLFESDEAGLVSSRTEAQRVKRIVERSYSPTERDAWIHIFHSHCANLRSRLEDDLANLHVYSLLPDEAAKFSDSAPFGEEVIAAFPSASFDVEEATKCLALGRDTACVLHLMRVMEAGLKAIGDRLGVDTTHKPGWEGVIRKSHSQMALPNDRKDASWIKDEAFLSDAIVMLTAVKTAWRNPTMHAEKTYTKEQATRIWDAVRGFMQQLATGLRE
jgi:hypothetical protein